MIKVSSIVKTCGSCPAQWEGVTSDGKAVYVRYRWGFLSVTVSDMLEDAIRGTHPKDEVYGRQLGHALDGVLEYEVLKTKTVGLIAWPEEEEIRCD